MSTQRDRRQPLGTAARCDGLADGWARRLANHQPVRAHETKDGDGPFYCAACHQEVLVRRGAERARHFTHRSDARAARDNTEGALHRACKQEIHAALAQAQPEGKWALERTLRPLAEAGVPMLRPDISGRVRGWPVAIEVQASALEIEGIRARTAAYGRRGIHLLWIVPVPEQLPDDTIRPKLHERYFHSMYMGRVYYWWPELGATVLPVHFGQVTRTVPGSEWFRPGVGRVQVGGYDAAYRTIKTLACGPRLHIAHDFHPLARHGFSPANERKAIPACHLWMDALPAWW